MHKDLSKINTNCKTAAVKAIAVEVNILRNGIFSYMNKYYKYIYILLSAVIFLSVNYSADSYEKIGKIYLEKRNIFDESEPSKWKLFENTANALHIITKDYVIENEILFDRDDELDEDMIFETERNLRNLGIFSKVSVSIDTNNNVHIITQDCWSTRVNFLLDVGGNERNWGGSFEEINFLGLNTKFKFEAIHKSINDLGWQNRLYIENARILKFGLGAKFDYFFNNFVKSYNASVFKQFRSSEDKFSYLLQYNHSLGDNYIYSHDNDFEIRKSLLHYKEDNIYAYFARSWKNVDRVFFSASLDINKSERKDYKIAYDNLGKLLFAFSSSAEDWVKMTGINSYLVEDIPIGGWGSAILGRIFPMKSGGMEPMFYVGGQAERSYLSQDDRFYLFGQLQASTCFSQVSPRFTYEEFLGLGFYKLSPKWTVGSRIRQQTIWNWGYFHRQLMLDNQTGLRGYRINELMGDNRIVTNLEFRWLPDIPFWFFNLGLNAFWDAGSVWRRGVGLHKTQWHHSVGLGLRLYNSKGGNNSGCFRVDFAYSFDKKKIAEVIISTNQFFSFFGTHSFEPPKVFGTEMDFE